MSDFSEPIESKAELSDNEKSLNNAREVLEASAEELKGKRDKELTNNQYEIKLTINALKKLYNLVIRVDNLTLQQTALDLAIEFGEKELETPKFNPQNSHMFYIQICLIAKDLEKATNFKDLNLAGVESLLNRIYERYEIKCPKDLQSNLEIARETLMKIL